MQTDGEKHRGEEGDVKALAITEKANAETPAITRAFAEQELQTSKASIITHLTSEIESKSTNIMNFRAKIAFTIFIGPFLLLGSIIVGTKGQVNLDLDFAYAKVACGALVLLFILLGYLGGRIEKQAWRRIKKWRKCICRIVGTKEITKDKLEEFLIDDTIDDGVITMYIVGFLAMLFAFVASAYIGASILTGSSPTSWLELVIGRSS